MKIKNKFELIYRTEGEVYNVVPISKSTLSAYQVDKIDFNYLIGLVQAFSRIRNHPTNKFVEAHARECIVVKMDTYPLPGFITNKNIPVINLSVLPVSLLSDYSSSDIFSLFLYSLALRSYIDKKPFTSGEEMLIANMIFSIFMKMFGKKSGLLGAYRDLIPRLKFLITLYAKIGMMGELQDRSTLNKAANLNFVDLNDVKTEYDFRSTIQFLKSINDNSIIPISEYKFSSSIITFAGMTSLPAFEDMSRFFATMLTSTISGNSQFSYYWSKVNSGLFNKIVDIAMKRL